MKCDYTDCTEPLAWVRSTQFSGDHLYCQTHAEQEADFGKENPSYFVWKPVEEYRFFVRPTLETPSPPEGLPWWSDDDMRAMQSYVEFLKTQGERWDRDDD